MEHPDVFTKQRLAPTHGSLVAVLHAPGGLGEICAKGFRNPFRCGFDRETDELFCGDVGHLNLESVKLVE